MEAAQRIEDICKAQDLSVSKLLKDCGLNVSVITDMKNKGITPSVSKILKIASYLGVSAEYLMTGQESTFTNNGVAAVQGYNDGHATVGGADNAPINGAMAELGRVMAGLSPRRQHELMAYAYKLEDEEKAAHKGGQ